MKRIGYGFWMILASSSAGIAWAQSSTSPIAAGNQAYQAKDYAKAEQFYGSALKTNSRSAKAYEGLGNCEYMLGHKEEALKDYRASLELDPSNSALKGFVESLQNQSSGRDKTTAATSAQEGSTDSDDKNAEDSGEEKKKPFHSFWDNQFQLGSTNQQAGQSTGFLNYTGTLRLTEGGDFLSAGLQTSRQKVEGVGSSTATLVLGGGLGLGSFTPSLNIGLGGGDAGWKQVNGTLNMALQLWDPFSVNLSLGGTSGSHVGPASVLLASLPVSITLPGNIAVDTNAATSSLGFTFVPWDWWSISPALGYQNDGSDVSYKGKTKALDQSDQIATLTLTLDFTLFKGFILELAPQLGQEYYPSGLSYSPETGGLVYNASANTQNFVGGTTSISYSFE